RRRRRAGPAGAGGRQGPHRDQGRRGRARQTRRRLLGRLPPDRRQARHQGIPHQGGGRAGALRRYNRTAACKGKMTMSRVHVSTTVNGDAVEYLCEADETLLDVLRDRLGPTAAKTASPPPPFPPP